MARHAASVRTDVTAQTAVTAGTEPERDPAQESAAAADAPSATSPVTLVGAGQGARRGTARRAVVAAVGAAGLTAALAACGGGTKEAGTQPEVPAAGGPEDSGQDTPPDNGGADDGAAGGSDGGTTGGGGSELAKTADIPKGGGKIFKAEKVVVTQPQDGDFKAFSAVCPHSGCIVGEVSGGTINCMCHGSAFDITDGSVKGGPSPRGLPTAKVNVNGGSVTLS